MAETEDKSAGEGEAVTPPTVPIPGVNVPDPTTGSEPEGKDPEGKDPEGKDPVAEAQKTPDSPDKAAEDGLA